MKLRSATLLASLILAASPAIAGSTKVDRGASGKGDVNPSSPNDCSDANVSSGTVQACVNFQQLSDSFANWANLTTKFDNNGNPVGVNLLGPFDLFLVPTTGPVTFQFLGNDVNFGSFLCDFDSTMNAQLNGFCTDIPNAPGDDLSGFLSSNPSGPDAKNQATFDFVKGVTGLPPSWVFYATSGD